MVMGRFLSKGSRRSFLRDRSGNVAMLWGLMGAVLIGLLGMSVDFTRAQSLRVKLQNAADGAVLVVDGVSGVEVQTEKAWTVAEELQLPRLIAVNRLDRDRASLDRVLESLRQTLGRTIVPIQLPELACGESPPDCSRAWAFLYQGELGKLWPSTAAVACASVVMPSDMLVSTSRYSASSTWAVVWYSVTTTL